jgi:hypothetical protein
VLQELCPRCNAEWRDGARACVTCGFDQNASTGPGTPRGVASRRPTGLVLLAAAAIAIGGFGAGFWLGSETSRPIASNTPSTIADGAPAAAITERGRVLFAERLGSSPELESYRTQFMRDGTIAWRAEFPEPPQANELTVVIAWYSIRESMKLSETTVPVRDPQLTVVATDEVQLADLVPTAGLYSVSYYSGDTKLAEGIFEVLPADR